MTADVYERITGQIVAELEKGVLPWLKPWNAEHAAGRITRPLQHNGVPYQGINVVMLWSAAVAQGFAAPIWMTFKQARAMGTHVRKGEKGKPGRQPEPEAFAVEHDGQERDGNDGRQAVEAAPR